VAILLVLDRALSLTIDKGVPVPREIQDLLQASNAVMNAIFAVERRLAEGSKPS